MAFFATLSAVENDTPDEIFDGYVEGWAAAYGAPGVCGVADCGADPAGPDTPSDCDTSCYDHSAAALAQAVLGECFAPSIDLGRGAVAVHVPPSYDPGTPMPLVLLLHGRGGSGSGQEAYMQFGPLADEFGFLYLHPDGRVDGEGKQFWGATDACCNFWGVPDTDPDYLMDLINEMKAQYNVDPRRVYLTGHSNGGFMSHRMACEHSDTIAAIASLNGGTYFDPNDCVPTEPVHVLQIHGTNDSTNLWEGGIINGGVIVNVPYPGPVQTVETWAAKNGCDIVTDTTAPNLDLDSGLAGAETTVTRYTSSCDSGGSAELWSIVGGTHVPALSPTFARRVVEYLFAHPKPGPTDIVYVDFGHSGSENGAEWTPWNTLAEALGVVDPNGRILINGNSAVVVSNETFAGGSAINQWVTLEASPAGSGVSIGVLTKGLLAFDKSGSSLVASEDGKTAAFEGDNDAFARFVNALIEAFGNSADEVAIREGIVFANALPYTRTVDGERIAGPNTPLAIRMRSDADIDPASIWGAPEGTSVEAQLGSDGSLRDIWVIVAPNDDRYFEGVIDLTLGATTVHGAAVQSANQSFQTDSDVEAAVVADLPSIGLDVPHAIEPEEVYATPQRIWLPIPAGVNADEVQLYYYHAEGDQKGWYPAENVEGWLVPGSYLSQPGKGVMYLGFLVRHAGIVQLGIPAESDE